MTILHYTIGLPPKRRGGSVQYASDLMQEQSKQGHKVIALTCGDTLFRGSKTKVKPTGFVGLVDTYCLTNPLTPTLIYGVADPDSQHRDIIVYERNVRNFIEKNHIEILHLHTFMGMHSDVVRIFKKNGVKIIYTSHDFHGICPHYNLINEKGFLCNLASGQNCARCNHHEPSDLFLRLVSSNLYQKLKSEFKKKPVIKTGNFFDKTDSPSLNITPARIAAFDSLLEYYRNYFSLIDTIHFNSSQTQEVFRHFLPEADGKVIPVITQGISDKRQPLSLHTPITFCFIGSTNDYKGFPLLREVIIELTNETNYNFKLLVYGNELEGNDPECQSIEFKGKYNYSDLSEILYSIDCMIVPSKWYETFSLVTLEALAHGRPVIVSDHVGAKDIVAQYESEFIFSNKEDLKKLLTKILSDNRILQNFNADIMASNWTYSLTNHSKEILQLYLESKK